MPSTITAEKAVLRESVKNIHLTDKERYESDQLLFQRFLSLPQLAWCSSILLYYGVGREPNTSQLIEPLSQLGKVLALPCSLSGGQMEARLYRGAKQLVPGPFGIPEPDLNCPVIQRDHLSAILVPGLCFDERGSRLGHGGGYYDRYLAGFSGLTIALGRDKLVFPSIPSEKHDLPVGLLLTETRCLSFSRQEKSGALPRFPCNPA